MNGHRIAWLCAIATNWAVALFAQQVALGGFDPVALCRGEEVSGKAEWSEAHAGYVYRFATPANRATVGETAANPRHDAKQLLLRAAASHGAADWRTRRYLSSRERGKAIVSQRIEVDVDLAPGRFEPPQEQPARR